MSARVTVIGSPEDPIRVTKVPADDLLPYALEVETVVPAHNRITLCWYDTLEEARAGYEALVRAVRDDASGARTVSALAVKEETRAALISRQAAIEAIEAYFGDLPIVVHHDMLRIIKELPSAQQEVDFDEWCIDCKEYDREKHRCPRCNRVIRDVLSVFKTGKIVRCKDCKHHEDESPGMVYCPDQVGGWVSEDFFCADGERRDDG